MRNRKPMNRSQMALIKEYMDRDHLEYRIGELSIIAAQKNKYDCCKGGPSNHWWEMQDRILDGFFNEFQSHTRYWQKRYGRQLTIKDISEFEDDYIAQIRRIAIRKKRNE